MLKWAIIFAIMSLVAGVLGFGGIAGASAGIAKILFFIFLAICAILLIAAIAVGKKIFLPAPQLGARRASPQNARADRVLRVLCKRPHTNPATG